MRSNRVIRRLQLATSQYEDYYFQPEGLGSKVYENPRFLGNDREYERLLKKWKRLFPNYVPPSKDPRTLQIVNKINAYFMQSHKYYSRKKMAESLGISVRHLRRVLKLIFSNRDLQCSEIDYERLRKRLFGK